MNKKKAIIIGAGIGGLGTASYLAKDGYQVLVLEKNDKIGGRANVFEEKGFKFDMGPSWYLMPEIFAHFFEVLGEKVEDYLDLVKLDPSYRIFFRDEDKKSIDIYSNLEKDAKTFEDLEPGSVEVLKKYLARSEYQYESAKEFFMYKNYDTIFDFFTPKIAKEGMKMNLFGTMDKYVKKHFKDSRLQKIMQYSLVFLGSEPKRTPALYNIMNYIDFKQGVYYPKGGIYELILALEKMARKFGAEIKTNSGVKEILVENGRAVGVITDNGEKIMADLVISNADLAHTETKMLKEKDQTYNQKYWDKRVLAPSAFILYLGLKDKTPELVHHNLVFSRNWDENFRQIFDEPKLPDDPSYYVCAPSVTDETVAPAGKEQLFLLVPIASRMEITDEEARNYRDKMITAMEKDLGIKNLRQRIEVERWYLPKDFKNDYNALGGTGLGLAHTLMQTAIFRPNNYSKKVKNLYYVGAGTNPGIGMPICLISAEMVYKRIKNIKIARPLRKEEL